MGSENAIEVKGITKKYDGFCLDNVSFTVPKGSVCGFIGQNGAGKTTTIKSILNILKPDSGSINVLGHDIVSEEKEYKEKIAVVFDEIPFHEDLNAKQLSGIMNGIFKQWNKEVYFNYLEEFGIPLKRKIGKFSKGMKMKLQIAVTLSHNAELLIMDEATSGLDPVVRNEVLDIFMRYMQDDNHSIFMSSHITTDLEKTADSIVFIDKGKILLSGYKDEIMERHGIIKSSKKDYQTIDKCDVVSARVNDFGVETMVFDRDNCEKKYSNLLIENTTLEEIMLFYVNKEKGEWN